MSAERLKSAESSLKLLGEKGSTRWKWAKAGLWGAGSFIVFAALSTSLVGAMAALLGGAYGYKRASSTS